MNNRKSNEDLTQERSKDNVESKFSLETYAEMILDESLLTRKLAIIKQQIDTALDQKDSVAFLHLTDELLDIQSQFQ